MDGEIDAVKTPGWDAINAALRRIYGDKEPLHWGTLISWKIGGPDPLDGISAYRRDGDNPHWHFVTYGLSELYAKESDDPDYSGYGFELTFRLRAEPGETAPPDWVPSFLQNLARYVFQTGNIFRDGDYMPLNGPIAQGSDTAIHAVIMSLDPELPPMETPNGKMEFLQIAGITNDELSAVKSWKTKEFAALLAQHMPLLVTDLARLSMMGDPAVQTGIAEGIARDGSSTGVLYGDIVMWEVGDEDDNPRLLITLEAVLAGDVAAVLPGRIPLGRPLTVRSGSHIIAFAPGELCGWARDVGEPNKVHVTLTPDVARTLGARLRPQRGVYEVTEIAGLSIEVVPTQICDDNHNVVEEIG